MFRRVFQEFSRRQSSRRPFDFALTALKGACACHLFLEYIGGPRMVSGPSMMPTMAASGEIVIEDNISHRLSPANLARGDLIVAISPRDPSAHICKRVLGLPGDVVCVDPTGTRAPSTEHVLVPKDHVWLMGDNAQWSRDSRDYGPVSMGLIRGKIVARVWPFKDFTIFRNPSTFIDEE